MLLRAMVKLLCMLAFSCVAHYWMQGAANEELMQIKARKEEVATMQEDLVNLRDEMVVFEKTCLMVSSPTIESPIFTFLMSRCFPSLLSFSFGSSCQRRRGDGRSSPSSACWSGRGEKC